jgi:hypothetical protein
VKKRGELPGLRLCKGLAGKGVERRRRGVVVHDRVPKGYKGGTGVGDRVGGVGAGVTPTSAAAKIPEYPVT